MTTAIFGLETMATDAAGREITYNENHADLEALIRATVLDRDLTAPPGSESEGDAYLVAASATGDWAGHDGEFAHYFNGSYRFIALPSGYQYYVVDEAVEVRVP